MRNIISNTSCLIVLDNINMLEMLKKLYGQIMITEEVLYEFGKPVPSWIQVYKVQDRKCLKILNSIVDLGEASTIAFCTEQENSTMILDDLKARKLAKKLDLPFTGTVGVLLKVKEKGIVTSMETILESLKNQGFRISKDIEQKLLKTNK